MKGRSFTSSQTQRCPAKRKLKSSRTNIEWTQTEYVCILPVRASLNISLRRDLYSQLMKTFTHADFYREWMLFIFSSFFFIKQNNQTLQKLHVKKQSSCLLIKRTSHATRRMEERVLFVLNFCVNGEDIDLKESKIHLLASLVIQPPFKDEHKCMTRSCHIKKNRIKV